MSPKRLMTALAVLAAVAIVVLAGGREGEDAPAVQKVDMRDRFVYRDASVPAHMDEWPVWAGNDHVAFAGVGAQVYLWNLRDPPQAIGGYTRELCSFGDGRVRWTETLWGGEDGGRVMARYLERFPDGHLEAHDAVFGREHLWDCSGYIEKFSYRGDGGVVVWSSLAVEPVVLERTGEPPMTMPFSGRQVSPGCMHYVAPQDFYFAFQCHNHPRQACAKYWIIRVGDRTIEEGCLPLPPREKINPGVISRIFWTTAGFVVVLYPHDKLRPNLWFFDTDYHRLDVGVATGVTVSPDGTKLTYAIVPSIYEQFRGPVRPKIRTIFFD